MVSPLAARFGRVPLLLLFFLVLGALPATAQLVADTVFTWQDYARTSTCGVQIYRLPADGADDRTHAIVLRELAENRGPSIVADASYLAERVGRHFGVDPTSAFWIYHWGAFSFEGARERADKELFLRATFLRTKRRALGTPQWRILTREDVEAHTDRQFQ